MDRRQPALARPVSRAELAKKKIENIFHKLTREREESAQRRAALEERLAALSVTMARRR